MAEGYNAPKDGEYKVSNSYNSPAQKNTNSGYGGGQDRTISLPVYQSAQQKPDNKRRSKCPRGAIVGQIGSCCGWECTRACAVPQD